MSSPSRNLFRELLKLEPTRAHQLHGPNVSVSMGGLKEMLGSYTARGGFGGSFLIPQAVAEWIHGNRSFIPLLLMLEGTKQVALSQGLDGEVTPAGLIAAFPYAKECAPYIHPKYAAIQVQEAPSFGEDEDPKSVIRQALEALAMQGHADIIEGECKALEAPREAKRGRGRPKKVKT